MHTADIPNRRTMTLQQTVENISKSGTKLEGILSVLDKEDADYLIYLLRDTNTPCSTISKALDREGHAISERTLQKERVKFVSEKNS